MDPSYIRMGSAEDAEAHLKKHGHWTVANLRQSIGWTTTLATVEYDGHSVILLPETDDLLPAIAVRAQQEVGRRTLWAFVSALCWTDRGVVSIESWAGGSRPFRTKKSRSGQIVANRFEIDYLPTPKEKTQQLALALFQDGMSLLHVHVAYSFLSFYKIVNLVSGKRGWQQTQMLRAEKQLRSIAMASAD